MDPSRSKSKESHRNLRGITL